MMRPVSFQCLLVEKMANHEFKKTITERTIADLPQGDVLIQVKYSSLNYKDALSANGNKGVTKRYPHVPGIDAAGIVRESSNSRFKPGDPVVVTGHDLGSNTWGGFSGFIRVPADWVVSLPESLSLKESMMLGTAGFTAGLAVFKLLHNGVSPDKDEVLVTGATGGVGSLAVAILARAGFRVVAATGKRNEKEFLESLGASHVIDRESILEDTKRPLLSGKWKAVVDTLGGKYLDCVLRSTALEGTVTTCGNVAGGELETSVYPFILRGVSLLGIGSAFTPMNARQTIWKNLSTVWRLENIERLSTEIGLADLNSSIDQMLSGKARGRTLVRI